MIVDRDLFGTQAGFSGRFELVVGFPINGVGGGEGLPAEVHAEAVQFGVAGEVPVGVVVVAEVVIVVGGEVFVLLLAPGRVMAFVEVAGFDGEGGDAYAGEAEMVGTVVAAGGGFGVGDDGEVEAFRGGFDGGEEGGALGSVDVDLCGDADGQDHVVVDVEGDLAGGDGWVLAEVFGAEEALFFGGDGGEDDGVGEFGAGLIKLRPGAG